MNKLFKLSKKHSRNLSFFDNTKKNLHVGVHSIDHDGCFGLPHMTPNEIEKKHAPVIKHLRQEKINKGYDFEYVLSGTNRQDIYRECENAINNNNNFAFPVVKEIARLLRAFHDPLLLSDIKAYIKAENKEEIKTGFTINYIQQIAATKKLNLFTNSVSKEILDELLKKDDHPKFAYSDDKINILYAQMHHIASIIDRINPHARISFNFYDDLIEKVISALQKFYESNSILIPNNVRLNLHYFNTINDGNLHNSMDVPELLHTIVGTGPINREFYNTVHAMEGIAIQEEGAEEKGKMQTYCMSKYITPARLEHHKLEHPSATRVFLKT